MKPGHHLMLGQSRQRVQGFTLLELLTVICIMGILATLAVSAIHGVVGGQNIQSGARTVSDQIQLARQLALTTNRFIQVRFYQATSGAPPVTAVGLYYNDTLQQASRMVRLPTGIKFSTNTTTSSLLSLTAASGLLTGTASVGGTSIPYFGGVTIRPDGSADITTGSTTYTTYTLTIYAFNDPIKANSLPSNFATVQLDPVTGITKVYQP